MSAFATFSGFASEFHTRAAGETVTVTPRTAAGAGTAATPPALVLRDPLGVRATDNQQRLEYKVVVQIAMADYPDGAGGGGGIPNVKSDTVAVAVRTGDTVKTTMKVAAILSQVGGMWHLGLGG